MNLNERRILVTGGAGFIGSQLAKDLLKEGAVVHVVDDLNAGMKTLVPDEATFDEVDIKSDALRDTVREFDPNAIVHLAAIHYIPYCNEHPEETFNVNVMGTRKVLNAAQSVDVDRFVFASSAAVYPPRKGPNHETDATGPTDIYGRTKLVGEDLTSLFNQETGTPAAAARIFNTYGPNETNEHLVPAILKQVADGAREIELGNLSPARDFIHVTDVSRALMTLLRGHDDGFTPYNLGTGVEHSVREVVKCTSEALGEDIRIVQDDNRVRESDRPHLQADPSRMRETFGWEAETDLVEGLRSLLKHGYAIA